MLPFAVLLLIVGLLFLIVRVLHLHSPASAPVLYFKDSSFNRHIIKACNLLTDPYVPPLLWGKSGHIQTIIYGKMGRVNSPFPRGCRHSMVMPDGATATFDVFEPEKPHPSGGDFTMLMCPGIANSSESLYICTCVHYAQNNGYRVAVLNHLGALADVPLTAPRIFTYGDTDEYSNMVDYVQKLYPQTRCVAVGFSMGANIVLKYLGENKDNQRKVLFAIACCAGYDADESRTYLMGWEHLRRVYLYAMSRHIVGLIERNRDMLFGAQSIKQHGQLEEDHILAATSLVDIDELYTRRRAGFDSITDYYQWCSSAHYVKNIDIPAFVLNALDDPIVPPETLHTPEDFARAKENVIFAATQHGGHLGYFEGSLLYPDTLTWLDKIIVQYADAAISKLVPGSATEKSLGKQALDSTAPSPAQALGKQALNFSYSSGKAALTHRKVGESGKEALSAAPVLMAGSGNDGAKLGLPNVAM